MVKNKKVFLYLFMLNAYSLIDASYGKSLTVQSKNLSRIALATAGCMIASQKPAHAELLIVKKDESGLAPLNQHDAKKYGPMIAKTLLKYQWPMCISQDLTDQEKQELLSSDKSCGEELFIQKKLQETIGQIKINPAVVFIPTTLYELFCIRQFFYDKDNKKPLYHAGRQYFFDDEKRDVKKPLDISSVLNSDADDKTMYQSVHQIYNQANNHFYADQNVSLYVNQECIKMFFEVCPQLKNCKNGLEASKIIEENCEQIAQGLMKEITELKGKMAIFPRVLSHNEHMQNHAQDLGREENFSLVKKIIALEYEARHQNKSLLLRGSSCEKFDMGFQEAKNITQLQLVGSTLRKFQCKPTFTEKGECDSCPEVSLLQAYQQDCVKLYSISFGGSLFASFLRGGDDSPFRFLKGERIDDRKSDSCGNVAGYALFVDKKDYVQDRNSHLFFIPPLSTIASLISNGEYFHPRITAAVKTKRDKPEHVVGIYGSDLKDSAEILVVQRNPLLHAHMVSSFIAKHGKIIQYGDDKNLTEEDKQIAQKVLGNHERAAVAYKAMHEQALKFKR